MSRGRSRSLSQIDQRPPPLPPGSALIRTPSATSSRRKRQPSSSGRTVHPPGAGCHGWRAIHASSPPQPSHWRRRPWASASVISAIVEREGETVRRHGGDRQRCMVSDNPLIHAPNIATKRPSDTLAKRKHHLSSSGPYNGVRSNGRGLPKPPVRRLLARPR